MSAFAPRPALTRPKSGTLDFPDNYQRRMIAYRDAIVEQGSIEMQSYREMQLVERYISYLDGQWWSQDRPSYRSKFFDNYLSDVRRESLSSLTATRPAMDISSKIAEYKDQATIVNNYIRHIWVNDDLDLKLVEWIDHALFGTGFWKIVCYSPGIFEITAHGLDEVLPIMMQGQDLQTARAVVYRTYQCLEYFIAKFGRDKTQGLEKYSISLNTSGQPTKYQRPGNIPEYSWNAMAPPMQRLKAMTFRPPQPQEVQGQSPYHRIDLNEIYSDDWSFNDTGHDQLVKHPDLDIDQHNFHYIVPNGCRLFPRKRLMIFGGDRVMYDGPAPFWSGLYPFAMLQLNPCVWGPGGISKYRDLIPLVRCINRIGAGVDETIVQAINSIFVGKRSAIDPVSWANFQPGKPGQKLLLNASGDPTRDLRRLDPPQLPAYIEQFLRYLVDDVRKRSGSLDIMGLSRKKQAPGGDTLTQMQESMSGPFQLEGRYVEAALKRAAIQAVSHVFQFANLTHRLKILGADGMTWQDFFPPYGEMSQLSSPKEDHWKMFSINLAPGSMHGSTKWQKKNEALVLRRGGDLSLRGLYDLAEVPYSVDQAMKELEQEHQMGIGVRPPAKGSPRQTRGQRTGSPL